MKGKLFGIGVGPGDPDLLTLKAIRAIQSCDVIAIPNSGVGDRTAFRIAESYLNGKEILECRFAMEKDMAKRREARQTAANQIMERLDAGKSVGFATLGDPTTYSTYMYVHRIIACKGFETEIIPGIASYSAAAAALGIALCEGDEVLTIIPARHSESIDELLDYPGNKIIMKSRDNLKYVLVKLKERGYGAQTHIVSRVTMDGEQIYADIEEFEKAYDSGYFTIAIVKEEVKADAPK